MAQSTDFVLANQSGATFRTELNTMLLALCSSNSGPAAPPAVLPGTLWFDTVAERPRFRNTANTAWLDLSAEAQGIGVTGMATVASINAINQGGLWRSASSDANNPPPTDTYRLLHIPGQGLTAASQIAIGENTARLWLRNRLAGAWDPWVEVPTGPLTTAQIAGSALRTSGEGFASLLDTELASAAWVKAFYDSNPWGYVSAQQTITSGSVLTLAHGLAARPTEVDLVLRCTTAQAPYAVGDEVESMISIAGPIYGATATADATNIKVRVGSGGVVAFNDTGTALVLTNSSWRIIVRARL